MLAASGSVVPGLGLTSLWARAGELGGSLTEPLEPLEPTRARLRVALRKTTTWIRAVVAVDDHPVVVSGLTTLIGAKDGPGLVGAARSVQDARDLDLSPPPVVDLPAAASSLHNRHHQGGHGPV